MKNICDFVVNFTVCLEMLWFFPSFFAIIGSYYDNQKG